MNAERDNRSPVSGPPGGSHAPDEAWPFGPKSTIVGDWIDNVSSFRILVLVGPMGALNGYVGVPEGHPWHGKDYGQCTLGGCDDEWCQHTPEGLVTVHGGITYAGWLEGAAPEGTAGLWWFGFDTVHLGDLAPGLLRYGGPSSTTDVLRGPEYVASEASKMAHQIAGAANG